MPSSRLFAARRGEQGFLPSFAEDDRHHFRFIVSPEDAAHLKDLRTFTRELMSDVERGLGTRLDWVATDHWNTDNPHVHVLIRGKAEDGQDLVMRRSGALPYSVAVTPVPVDAVGLQRGKVLVAVVVGDPHAIQPDMARALQTTHGLTPAEASLVELLAHETPSLIEAADRLGVSQTTVKTHLRHCYHKTGTHRQTELIRLAPSAVGLLRRGS